MIMLKLFLFRLRKVIYEVLISHITHIGLKNYMLKKRSRNNTYFLFYQKATPEGKNLLFLEADSFL